MDTAGDTAKLAVLIDSENAQLVIIEALLAEVAKYGTAHVKRAYGDWTGAGLRGWKDLLLAQSIQPIQQFAYATGKNATDSALIIDAMDLLYSGRFDGFCIVSSDSDFTRLASHTRESGLTVCGFAERKTPKVFVAACDKFIYTENLADTQNPATVAAKAKPAASLAQLNGDTRLLRQLHNAVEAASNDDGWAPLVNVGHIITKQRPDFDSRTYGYAKLSDLIAATALFEMERRNPGDGKPDVIYIRDKRRQGNTSQLSGRSRERQRRIPASGLIWAGQCGERAARHTSAMEFLERPRRWRRGVAKWNARNCSKRRCQGHRRSLTSFCSAAAKGRSHPHSSGRPTGQVDPSALRKQLHVSSVRMWTADCRRRIGHG